MFVKNNSALFPPKIGDLNFLNTEEKTCFTSLGDLTGLKESFLRSKNLGERSATSEPFKPDGLALFV